MRIGLVCLRYGWGGAGHHVESLSHELTNAGHDVWVLAGRDFSNPRSGGKTPEVTELGLNPRHGFPSLWSSRMRHVLWKRYRRSLSELDVLNGNPVSGDFAAQANRLGLHYVSTLHGSLRSMLLVEKSSSRTDAFRPTHLADRVCRRVDSWIERREYLLSDAVAVVSQTVAKEYEAVYGSRPHRYVIPPCAKQEFFESDPAERGDHGSLVAREAGQSILYVGSSLPRKGFLYLLYAFKLLSRSNEGLRLLVVTGGPDPIICDLARREGLTKRMVLFERVSVRQLKGLMRSADVLAFPSLYEGLPLTIIEAMTQGLPAVGFATTGVTDAIEHGETGYLAPRCDVRGFANYVQKLLSDSSLREEMRRKAREIAKRLYRPALVTEAYLSMYRAVLESP